MQFRDYQLNAIRAVYEQFGITPAGPENDQIVAHCRGDSVRQNRVDGRASEVVASGPSDANEPQIRTEPTGNQPAQQYLW